MKRLIKAHFSYVKLGNGGPIEGREPYDLSLEKEVKSKRIVCDRCDGEGTHVNPNIDGHGLTHEDFDRDPEFKENYLDGVYDISCEECKGERVVDIVDIDALNDEDKIAYQRSLDEIHYQKTQDYYERRACGLID